MRDTIKNFNSHLYLWYEYKALKKIKDSNFTRKILTKTKEPKTIIDENKKKYYCRGKRISLTEDTSMLFIAKKLIENNRLDLLTDEFFEIEK